MRTGRTATVRLGTRDPGVTVENLAYIRDDDGPIRETDISKERAIKGRGVEIYELLERAINLYDLGKKNEAIEFIIEETPAGRFPEDSNYLAILFRLIPWSIEASRPDLALSEFWKLKKICSALYENNPAGRLNQYIKVFSYIYHIHILIQTSNYKVATEVLSEFGSLIANNTELPPVEKIRYEHFFKAVHTTFRADLLASNLQRFNEAIGEYNSANQALESYIKELTSKPWSGLGPISEILMEYQDPQALIARNKGRLTIVRREMGRAAGSNAYRTLKRRVSNHRGPATVQSIEEGFDLGLSLLEEGQYQEAKDVLGRIYAQLKDIEDSVLKAKVVMTQGIIEEKLTMTALATEKYDEAMACLKSAKYGNNTREYLIVVLALSRLKIDNYEFDIAEKLLEDYRCIDAEMSHYPVKLALIKLELGRIYANTNRVQEASRIYKECEDIISNADYHAGKEDIAMSQLYMAILEFNLQRNVSVIRRCHRVLASLDAAKDEHLMMMIKAMHLTAIALTRVANLIVSDVKIVVELLHRADEYIEKIDAMIDWVFKSHDTRRVELLMNIAEYYFERGFRGEGRAKRALFGRARDYITKAREAQMYTDGDYHWRMEFLSFQLTINESPDKEREQLNNFLRCLEHFYNRFFENHIYPIDLSPLVIKANEYRNRKDFSEHDKRRIKRVIHACGELISGVTILHNQTLQAADISGLDANEFYTFCYQALEDSRLLRITYPKLMANEQKHCVGNQDPVVLSKMGMILTETQRKHIKIEVSKLRNKGDRQLSVAEKTKLKLMDRLLKRDARMQPLNANINDVENGDCSLEYLGVFVNTWDTPRGEVKWDAQRHSGKPRNRRFKKITFEVRRNHSMCCFSTPQLVEVGHIYEVIESAKKLLLDEIRTRNLFVWWQRTSVNMRETRSVLARGVADPTYSRLGPRGALFESRPDDGSSTAYASVNSESDDAAESDASSQADYIEAESLQPGDNFADREYASLTPQYGFSNQ